jgi:hypothetical protein
VRKKGKASFEVPDSNIVGCVPVSTGKGDFLQGNIAYNFRSEHRRNNGFLLTKIGNLCCFITF